MADEAGNVQKEIRAVLLDLVQRSSNIPRQALHIIVQQSIEILGDGDNMAKIVLPKLH